MFEIPIFFYFSVEVFSPKKNPFSNILTWNPFIPKFPTVIVTSSVTRVVFFWSLWCFFVVVVLLARGQGHVNVRAPGHGVRVPH